MNARLHPFGSRLAASYDHAGARFDLYGTIDNDGYTVKHVMVPGTLMTVTECFSEDLLANMSAHLDDTLPTAEEMRKESRAEARIEHYQFMREMRH